VLSSAILPYTWSPSLSAFAGPHCEYRLAKTQYHELQNPQRMYVCRYKVNQAASFKSLLDLLPPYALLTCKQL
jgi:hypothetical protein